MIYVIGSLRNPKIPEIANAIRKLGIEAFDSWYAPGPEADDFWQKYEQGRGHTYIEALNDYAARHVFEFDRLHLDRATSGVLVLPAGKSCHLELGYLIGQGKPGYILLDQEPERWDVMYGFATVVPSVEELLSVISTNKRAPGISKRDGEGFGTLENTLGPSFRWAAPTPVCNSSNERGRTLQPPELDEGGGVRRDGKVP